jgi:hypothetical protein
MHGWLLLESGNSEPAQKQLEHYLKAHDAAEAKAIAASAAKQLTKDGKGKDGHGAGKDGHGPGKEGKDVKAAAAHQRQARATAYLRLLAADALLERHAQQEHAHTAAKRCGAVAVAGGLWRWAVAVAGLWVDLRVEASFAGGARGGVDVCIVWR